MDYKNIELTELLRKSFKKLKSGVFFDKTQLHLRDRIVAYECDKRFDDSFSELIALLKSGKWDKILNSIDYLSFPKSIVKAQNPHLISNWNSDKTTIDDLQYFLDMSVEGHILGVTWTLIVGSMLDSQMYEHSYGNRLRKNLFNDNGTPTYSPYLFEPYFQQYESWRDTALSDAKKALNKDQDVVVLMLDFSRFYYSVNIDENELSRIINSLLENSESSINESFKEIVMPLTNFVFRVIKTYSDKIRTVCPDLIQNRNILPIGFYPSNVLSNYALKKFDDTMINGWNPIYYGRYVDDIIIVEKIEKNSDNYQNAKNDNLTPEMIIDHYLTYCSAWQRNNICNSNNGLLVTHKKENNDNIEYTVNSVFNTFPGSNITVQKKKVNIFYFKSGQSDALLRCFQEKIRKNKSEFRFLPEDVSAFQEGDYIEIYDMQEGTSPHKLRDVSSISVDRFNLSKYLGKYTRISGLVSDIKENQFEQDIEKIFTPQVIIENYTIWEKVLEILIINEKFDVYLNFLKHIKKAIEKMDVKDQPKSTEKTEFSLFFHLFSSICRTLSLVWGKKVQKLIKSINKDFSYDYDVFASYYTSEDYINGQRIGYCRTRMNDKYAMPFLIDEFINRNNIRELFPDDINVNLTDFNSVKNFISTGFVFEKFPFHLQKDYLFYPYMITMNDLCFSSFIHQIFFQCNDISINKLKNFYIKINYNLEKNSVPESETQCEAIDQIIDSKEGFLEKDGVLKKHIAIKVESKTMNSIKIAVANTRLFERNIENALNGTPNRTLKRYNDFVRMVNEAINCKADMLIMPECCIPLEWLPILSRTCARNQLAVITGVEHVVTEAVPDEKTVGNYTAVILPFVENGFKYSFMHLHKKVHMSPHEKEIFESRSIRTDEGKEYELYDWNDFWFSVYCCYELTSISDRAVFQSYIDALIAVEWNKDTNYYSNIVESLSRDIHCFCVQVNTSEFGDSRITKPSKTENRDIIKVKGGQNSAVLTDNLNFVELREFQLKGNKIQSKDNRFKQTPPDFDYEIVRKKHVGKLWDSL